MYSTRLGKLARTAGGKGDSKSVMTVASCGMTTVDVPVSWVCVMEVKSVTHVIRPHDIKSETKGFAIGTAIDLTRIVNSDGGGVVGKNMADSDGPRLRLVRKVLVQGLEFAARPPSAKTNYSAT